MVHFLSLGHRRCGRLIGVQNIARVTRAKSRLAASLVKLLRTLQTQLQIYRAEIVKLFAQHAGHDLFGSLPGAGDKRRRGSERDRQ